MKTFLDPFFDEYKIIAYIRSPFDISTKVQQQLKGGNFDFTKDESTILPNFKKKLNPYINIFGKESLILREYNKIILKRETLFMTF